MAARSTHLAYGYLRGTSYGAIEQTCETYPNFAEVVRMVKQYGAEKDERIVKQKLASWFGPISARSRLLAA